MKFYTIKEIANMSGVSAGTVDRVLHKRGKVSAEKEQRVNAVLKKIDYRPNMVARSLKMNKKYRLVVLLPNDELDAYWNPCFMGINEIQKSLLEKGIFLEILKYDPGRPSSFIDVGKKSFSLEPDGVLLGALFQKESQEYLNLLDKKSIPYVLINSIVEKSNPRSFVGQDLHQSGRTAAHLLDCILPSRKSLLIVHLAEEYENALHMQQKEMGFRSYFKDKEGVAMKTLNVKAGHELSLGKVLDKSIIKGIDGVFVTTSKAHLLVHTNLNVPIIGYDLIRENIDHLNKGKIKFLIYQNPKMQAVHGLNLLVDHLTLSAENAEYKYLPIEIVTKENISTYIA